MEGLIAILLLGALVLTVVIPVVALVKAGAASDRVRQLETRVDALEAELDARRAGDSAWAESVSAVRRRAADQSPPVPATLRPDPPPTQAASPAAAGPAPWPPPLPMARRAATPVAPSPAGSPGGFARPLEPDAPGAPAPASAPPAPIPVRPVVRSFDWEEFMGAKLFAWVGGLALFLGVAFFLKYSFEHNLIPPEMRVAMGFVAGLGLLVGGFLMNRRKYLVTSHALCATGVLVLYAVTFACRAVYHFEFFGVVPTFLLMVLVTAVAFLLAVRLNAQVVAVLGLLGGFLTPVLLSTGHDQAAALFGYIALLDLGLVAVALHRRWGYLAALAMAGTVIMQWGWFAEFFAVAKAPTALAIFLGFAVFMTAVAAVASRRSRLDHWLLSGAVGLAASAFVFALAMLGVREVAIQPAVFFAAVFVPDLCLMCLSLIEPRRVEFHVAGAGLVFGLLMVWIGQHVDGALLNWALGAAFGFALLHCAFPLVRRRLHPGVPAPRWLEALPLVAIVLMMPVVLGVDGFAPRLWFVLLVIDLLVVAVAVLARAAWIVAAAVGLTVVALACWIGRIPPTDAGALPGFMVTVGGFALVFVGLSLVARKRLAEPGNAGPLADWEKPFEAFTGHLPALSAVLPFLLLVMAAVRLPLLDPFPVFGLALVLVVLLLGLARLLPDATLPLVGLLSVGFLEHIWQQAHLIDAVASRGGGVALAWHLVFWALFAVFPFLFRARFADRLVPWVASALSGPLHFYLVHRLVRLAWPNDFLGLIPALFAVPSLMALVVVVRKVPASAAARPAQLAWFGAVVLFFVTLIVPIQFRREWITLGWALEGAALLWLFHRVPHSGLRLVGVALLLVAFARLALNPMVLSYHPRSDQPLLNWYLYTYGLTAGCLAAGAWLLRPPRNLLFGKSMPPVLWGLATVLVFLLVNIEIADYFAPPGRAVLVFEFSGSLARDMAYTIAWALFALALLIVGLGRRLATARYAGLALLGIALLKLFLHDLSALANFYRIGALVITAVIAMIASFLYQKLATPAKDDEPATPPAL